MMKKTKKGFREIGDCDIKKAGSYLLPALNKNYGLTFTSITSS